MEPSSPPFRRLGDAVRLVLELSEVLQALPVLNGKGRIRACALAGPKFSIMGVPYYSYCSLILLSAVASIALESP